MVTNRQRKPNREESRKRVRIIDATIDMTLRALSRDNRVNHDPSNRKFAFAPGSFCNPRHKRRVVPQKLKKFKSFDKKIA